MNKKRILQLIIAASTFAGGIAINGTAVEAKEVTKSINNEPRAIKKGEVVNISSSLRVRSNAGTNSSIIGYLYNGDKFDILGKQGEWYKISYYNSVGYIYKDYVKEIQVDTSTSTGKKGQVINISSNLRVRSESNTSSLIKGTLTNGETFDIISKKGDWYNIKKGSLKGYVHGDYVKVINGEVAEPPVTNPPTDNKPQESVKKNGKVINISTNLRVRSSADMSSSVLGYLTNGENVKITGEKGSWYQINFKEKTGYVHKDYIKIVEGTETSKPDTSTGNNNSEIVINKMGEVYNISTNLRVRSAANSNSSVLGYLMNGSRVKIAGKSGSWYKINFNGKTGYVHSDYIKIVNGDSQENQGSSYKTIYNAMKSQIGSPYVWGGAGEMLTTSLINDLKKRFPSNAASGSYTRAEKFVNQGYRAFDCSGLMQWGFRQAGIHIGRTTWDQINAGVEVSLNSLKPGDLVFYSDLQHVGMYVGDGQWLESPNKSANVRVTQIPWNKVGRARRVLN